MVRAPTAVHVHGAKPSLLAAYARAMHRLPCMTHCIVRPAHDVCGVWCVCAQVCLAVAVFCGRVREPFATCMPNLPPLAVGAVSIMQSASCIARGNATWCTSSSYLLCFCVCFSFLLITILLRVNPSVCVIISCVSCFFFAAQVCPHRLCRRCVRVWFSPFEAPWTHTHKYTFTCLICFWFFLFGPPSYTLPCHSDI